jgi:hypothetical protein
MCCFSDGQLGWKTIADFNDCAPLCKATSLFIKGFGAAGKTVKTGGSILAVCATNDDKSLV